MFFDDWIFVIDLLFQIYWKLLTILISYTKAIKQILVICIGL